MNRSPLDLPAATPPPDLAPPAVSEAAALDEVRRVVERATARYRADLEKLTASPVDLTGQAELRPSRAETPSPITGGNSAIQADGDPIEATPPAAYPVEYPALPSTWRPHAWQGAGLLVAICALLALGIGLGTLALTRRPTPAAQPTSAAMAGTIATPVPAPSAPPTASLAILPPSAFDGGTPLTGGIGTTPSAVLTTPVSITAPTATMTPTAASVTQRVAAAEAALRSGEFEATIDYGDGVRAQVRVRFDLGDAQHPRRIHIVSTFRGRTGSQTFEQLAIGDQTWQRQPDGRWVSAPTPDGMWEQFRAYLPNARVITGATLEGTGDTRALRYDNPERGVNTALYVETSTGMPLQLHQEPRPVGPVLTVIYDGWNVPVIIDSPPAN